MTSPVHVAEAPAGGAAVPAVVVEETGQQDGPLEGRSPGRLMWLRFKCDRTGVVSGIVVLFFFVIAALAPVISWLYGKNPYTLYGLEQPGMLDDFGGPTGPYGGMSSDFWFGIEPTMGRDVLTQLLYGMRTSLYTALLVTILAVLIGALIGLIGGYYGGKVDYWLGQLTDFLLVLPGQLFLMATMPVVTAVFVPPDEETPTYIRALAMIIVLSFFTWMGIARLMRGSILSLKKREFVEAAKISGASPWRIIRKELLPNLATPMLVQGTYMLPSTILGVAFLSYIGVGFVEPTPDWGRMFNAASRFYETNPTYMYFPGFAMVIFVVAFNLLGDSVRDAFDPKAGG